MDQRIFDQLDQLQRGARELAPRQQGYNNSRTGYSGYGGNDAYRGGSADYYDESEDYADENVDPLGHVLPYEQHSFAVDRASDGRNQMRSYGQPWPVQSQPDHIARRFDLSRFALDDGAAGSSSSGLGQPQHSSPAFKASQRRPPLDDFGRTQRETAPRTDVYNRASQSFTGPHAGGTGPGVPGPSAKPEAREAEPSYANTQISRKPRQAANGRPVVQGITLVSTHDLPDRFRSIFPFPLFNAVQSKCFSLIYGTNDNFVLSSPTGSGKTAILELAICRLMNGFASGTYKIVYQAPTKSLCSERQRDWQAKFGPFDMQVAALTGDTDNAQLRNVQHASIIITTPEKWDSMTRKWKDHQRLMQMVKLFLIDEVHILKEDRGATLEAIVSRMKSVGSDLRFVALSATVPNSQDIAIWLGKDSVTPHLPAPRERLGEEFRPVRLAKHVCGYQAAGNDFAFEKTLNAKLPDVISKWSQRKPIMVFCFTRNACIETARLLSNWWAMKSPRDRYWEAPRKRLVVEDKDLRDTIASGVAFHHAGLSITDRTTVERGYLDGDVNVICCTSTLAVGINLPCHMVIIKNTVTYSNNGNGGCKEYSDLEIMQMLGRAGRPQFDNSAVAVIMTRLQRVQHYQKMVTGQETLESCLHRNLIDHLNAEIGLGTITNASSAKKWLSGTFLYVRLKENPEHYRIDGDASGRNLDERLEAFCNRGIASLGEHDLIQKTPKLRCTEFGDAMTRYYIQFETMKLLLALPPQAKTSEILSAIAQAAEYKEIRFRAGEKPTYKELNKNGSIKFPIPVNLDASAHKVSLVIQATLGAVDLPSQDYKQRTEFNTARTIIFQSVNRLIKCVVDCNLFLEDSVTSRNALALARSLGARVWDDSPLHLKQLDGVGLVTVRKLAAAGIRSIEDIDTAEHHRIEQILSRNPPYGAQLQEKARAFPRLRVSLMLVGEPVVKQGEHVAVRICAEVSFLNEKIPDVFNRKTVSMCMLAEVSDGHVVQFTRISAKRLHKGTDISFTAHLTQPNQSIRVHVSCEDIAGTLCHAVLKPDIPFSAFPTPKTAADSGKKPVHAPNTAKRRAESAPKRQQQEHIEDEFDDAGLDDSDLVLAEDPEFANIDDFEEVRQGATKGQKKSKGTSQRKDSAATEDREPRQLENGKWACKHACKDKTACKHLCCREGLDKKPKPSKPKEEKKKLESSPGPKQTQLSLSVNKSAATASMQPSRADTTIRTKNAGSTDVTKMSSHEMQSLNRLHGSVQSNTRLVPTLGSFKAGQASAHRAANKGVAHSETPQGLRPYDHDASSSDYGHISDFETADKPSSSGIATRMSAPALQDDDELWRGDEDMLDAGDDDFDHLQPFEPQHRQRLCESHQESNEDELQGRTPDSLNPDDMPQHLGGVTTDQMLPMKARQPFLEASSDSAAADLGIRTAVGKRGAGLAGVDLQMGHSPHAKRTKVGHSDIFSREALEESLIEVSAEAHDSEFGQELETVQEGETTRSSDPGEWFAREFGMDAFNYIG